MDTRSTRSTVTFFHAFNLPGFSKDLSPGDYEVMTEDELLQGLNFQAYRRTGTYLLVHGIGAHASKTELRIIKQEDLDLALSRDRNLDAVIEV